MAQPSEFNRTSWKRKDIIRNIHTGKPMKVVHVFLDVCTMIGDISQHSPVAPLILWPKDYHEWAKDTEMVCKVSGSGLEWHRESITI